MDDLRESILRTQLHRELELARKLGAEGKNREAGIHYTKASALYRRIAYNSTKEKAEEMFRSADQYEHLGKMVKDTSKLRAVGEISQDMYEEEIGKLIITEKPDTKWEDIGGLKEAKRTIKEAIIMPFIKEKPPFVKSPRTILLFGPPGTGKTMLAKASSNTLNATFFEARTSVLLSKYFGESGRLISAFFGKVRKMQPSLVFMDELDSVASKRTADMNEASRRVLSQLLTEIDGFNTNRQDRVLVMAATNKPWDLDDAAVSRFQRRIYVPLPDMESREKIFEIHLKGVELSGGITEKKLAERSEGFSGRDIASVCQDAIMEMVREMNPDLEKLTGRDVPEYTIKTRDLGPKDFEKAFIKIKPALSEEDVKKYEKWKEEFGE